MRHVPILIGEKVFISILIGTALIVGAMLLNRARPQIGPDDWRLRGPQFVRATGKFAECHNLETPAIVHLFETAMPAPHGSTVLAFPQPVAGRASRLPAEGGAARTDHVLRR